MKVTEITKRAKLNTKAVKIVAPMIWIAIDKVVIVLKFYLLFDKSKIIHKSIQSAKKYKYFKKSLNYF